MPVAAPELWTACHADRTIKDLQYRGHACGRSLSAMTGCALNSQRALVRLGIFAQTASVCTRLTAAYSPQGAEWVEALLALS